MPLKDLRVHYAGLDVVVVVVSMLLTLVQRIVTSNLTSESGFVDLISTLVPLGKQVLETTRAHRMQVLSSHAPAGLDVNV